MTSPWRVVAAREINYKLHDKTFLMSTAFMLVIVVGALLVPAIIGTSNTTVGVTDKQSATVVQTAADSDSSLVVKEFSTTGAAEKAVSAGTIDVALLKVDRGYEVVGDTSVGADVRESLATAAAGLTLRENAAAANVDVNQLLAGSQVTERELDPAPFPPAITYALTFGFAFIFYITAISFGMVLAQSVVQEKETRIVEILAAAIPIRALLAGKVVGNTLLALGQIALLLATALVGLQLTGRTDMLADLAAPAGWFAVFFLLGFIALAGMWAVAGAISTRQEDLQSTTLPAQAVLMIPLFVVLAGNDTAVNIASYVPIASSFAMPVRMVSEDVPLWQPLVAALIVLVAAAALVLLAARIYERSLLKTDAKMGYRELLRS